MTATAQSILGRLGRALACAAVVLPLCACSGHGIRRVFREHDCNKPQPYQRAGSIAPLKVPVGIDPPDTRHELHIPAYNHPAPPPRKLTEPCLDAPPPFVVPKGNGGSETRTGSAH